MTISVKHNFVSARPQTSNTAIAGKNEWNAEHVLSCAALTVLGRSSNSAGALQEISTAAGSQYVLQEKGGNYQQGVINSFDADGFTIGWTKVGTPTGTCAINALCVA